MSAITTATNATNNNFHNPSPCTTKEGKGMKESVTLAFAAIFSTARVYACAPTPVQRRPHVGGDLVAGELELREPGEVR